MKIEPLSFNKRQRKTAGTPTCIQGEAYKDPSGAHRVCSPDSPSGNCPRNYVCYFDGYMEGCCPTRGESPQLPREPWVLQRGSVPWGGTGGGSAGEPLSGSSSTSPPRLARTSSTGAVMEMLTDSPLNSPARTFAAPNVKTCKTFLFFVHAIHSQLTIQLDTSGTLGEGEHSI